jgi:hypothetical protein
MRALTGRGELDRFMTALGKAVRTNTRVYLVGGASAVLLGWRDTTIDIDLAFVPESDEVYRAIARFKDDLNVNVELAAPDHFIPPVPGWEERSPLIARHGAVSFHHYDFYAQALAKIERGHATDQADVDQMLRHGLIEVTTLREKFAAIEPQLYRYPAVDAAGFAAAVRAVVERR